MQRRRVVVALVLVLAGWLAYAFRGPLSRAAIAATIDVATGYRVSFDALSLGSDEAVATGLHVRRGRDPVLDAARFDVVYTLRDLLPGGARRYGLRSIVVDDAAFWIVRHRDGSLNVGSLPAPASPAASRASAATGAPLRFTARVNGGSLTVLDPYRVYAGSRKIILGHLHVDAGVDTGEYTHYAVRAQLVTEDTLHAPVPFGLAGTIDRARGYGLHHLTIGALPLRDLVNYAMNSRTAHLFAGEAHGIDVEAYALDLGSLQSPGYHVSGGADISGGVLYVPGIIRPLRDLRGRLNVYDGGLAAKNLTGSLADLPLRASGAIYNWSHPSFRLGLVAAGPLASARTLFGFSEHLPVTGERLDARILIEGPVGLPLIFTALRAPSATYANLPLRDVRGELAYYDSTVTLLPIEVSYGAFAVSVRGGVDFNKTADSDLMVDALAPPHSLPYVAQTLPGVPLRVTGTIVGNDLDVEGRGVFDGAGGGDRIAGLFDIDKHGNGMFGPAEIVRSDGTLLAGAFYLNRSANQSGFWLNAHNFLLKGNPTHPTLPGLERLAPPEFDAVLDGAIAGAGTPSSFQLAGRVHAHDLAYGAVKIADVTGAIVGSPADIRLGDVRAQGPWGRFEGRGDYGGGRTALEGTYHGSYQALREFTGDLGAQGSVDGPVALLFDSHRLVVQTRGASSPGARVHGVPIDGLRGTVAIAGKRLDVYAATATLAGGRFAARGTLGGGHALGVSVAGADARALRASGSPLERGSVAAIGDVAYDGTAPIFEGGVAVQNGRVGKIGVAGDGDVRADASHVALTQASALIGPAYGLVDGSVDGIGRGPIRYALVVRARDVPISPFARLLAPRRHDIAGIVDSTLNVSGTGSGTPSVSGDVAVAEGTFNGQAFSQLRARVGTAGGGVSAQDGSIVVGTTHASFGATLKGGDSTLNLNVPKADLTDFDDLFDTGDTLGGRGRIVGHFVKRGDVVSTDADVAIAGLRYRLFNFGDASAHWASRARLVDATIALAGPAGNLSAKGVLTLPPHEATDRLLQRSSFDGTAQLRGLDLGVWLPLLGYEIPVGGLIDADATLNGPLRSPIVHTDASIVSGHLWKLPVDRASFALDTTLTRTTIRHAEIDLPNVVLSASGSLGFSQTSPVDLALHANSTDVGALALKLYGEQLPLTGAAEVDIHIDGSRAKPRITGGFDLEKAAYRGVAIPRALGELSLQGREVVLSDAEVLFAKGGLYLAGSVPLQISPFGLGPPKAPLELEIAARAIDMTDFGPLLPAGSTLTGTLDGRVALNGTAGDPQLIGDLALTGGAIASPYEKVPLTNMRGSLTFTAKSVTLEAFHVEGGGGTLDLSGHAQVPDLVHLGADSTYAFEAKSKGLRLDLPAFGQGQLDGTLAIAHSPGQLAVLSGNETVQNGVVPFSALLLAGGGGGGVAGPTIPVTGAPPVAAPPRTDLAFNFNVTAGPNMRVRSGNVDIGGRGELALGGTMSAPLLTGHFESTGGTLSYFNTVFRIESATVGFTPDQGVVPSLNAVAITHVINPDPNSFRNPNGTADITLDVTGPVTSMNLQLASDPPYDRQTILGLLLNAPAIGATNLFQTTLPGSALPPGVAVNRGTGELSVGQEAFGILNAQFTRNLLSPIETQVGGALGLSSLAFNLDYGGGLGVTARKVLGKTVDLIYAQSFTYPYRQSFGFNIKPNPTTAAQVTVFDTLGAQGFGTYGPLSLNSTQPYNQRLILAQPLGGTAGFSFSLQRLFW